MRLLSCVADLELCQLWDPPSVAIMDSYSKYVWTSFIPSTSTYTYVCAYIYGSSGLARSCETVFTDILTVEFCPLCSMINDSVEADRCVDGSTDKRFSGRTQLLMINQL